MSNIVQWANNAGSTLASSITTSQTTITLTSGGGALFPILTSGQFFALSITQAGTTAPQEIVYCTARSGDTLTVERAQEGTPGTAFNAGDLAQNLITAGTLAEYGQLGAANVWSQQQTLGQGAVLPNNVTIEGKDTSGTAHPLIGMGITNEVTIDGAGVGAATGGTFTLGTPGTSGNQAVAISQFPGGLSGNLTFMTVPNSANPSKPWVIQSATVNIATGNGDVVALPVAFPNAILNVISSDGGSGCHATGWQKNGSSLSSFLAYGLQPGTNTPETTSFTYIAIGN